SGGAGRGGGRRREALTGEGAGGFLERGGSGGAGRDRIHADLVRAELAREVVREPVDAVFGDAVVPAGDPRGGRRLIHDRAAAALLHRAVARARAQERALHVHVHEALVVVPVHREQRVELHVAEDRGVVDEEIDAAERLRG